MADKVTEYKCPSCTGPLSYSAQSGLLECEYCGAKFETKDIEAAYKDKIEEAESAVEAQEEQSETETEQSQWDYTELSEEWGADESGMAAYNCSSCGAELICDSTTAATECPYCGNNAIVPGRLSGALKPDLILPFKLDKEQAIKALKKHYRGKWLLPKAFSDANHIEKIQGVYVPFWLYNANVDIDCYFDAQKVRTRKRGDMEIIDTEHYNVCRSGSVDFSSVPVDGSTKMNDSYMDSLEPFDYTQLEKFSTVYLPGFMADRYDQDAVECSKRADARCKNSAIAAMRADVTGYTNVTLSGSNARINRGKVHYALLPVWVLHTKWEKKDYLFMMNGQTGKFVGNLPVDKRKFRVSVAVGAAVFALILHIAKIAPFIGGIIAEWALGIS